MTLGLSANVGHIECPKCGVVSEFECWPIVPNVFVPEVAEAAREGLLFEYECEICGYRDLASYRCLYHDIPHAKLVLFEPDPEKRVAAEADLARMIAGAGAGAADEDAGVVAGAAAEASVVVLVDESVREDVDVEERKLADIPKHVGRLVLHPDRFSEKARIFEAELDDCAIELLKLQVKERLVGEDPLFETALIYFSRFDGSFITFLVVGYEDYSVAVPMAAYEQLLLDFMMRPPIVPGFVVDESWATGYLLDGMLGEVEERF